MLAAAALVASLAVGGWQLGGVDEQSAPPSVVQASAGVMTMVGIATAVLGILALLGVGPALTLTLVALLCVGASLVLAGGALTARFARRFV